MPTILQIIPNLDSGGAERTTVEMTRAIVADGGRALVATRGGRLAAAVEAAGGRIIRLPVHAKDPLTMIANGVRLARLVRMERVDLIDVRSRAPAWSALLARSLTDVAVIATYHGAYSGRNPLKRLYNSGMVRGDLVIANSEFTAASIRKQYSIRADRLAVIPRGADLEAFDPAMVSQARIEATAKAWGAAARRSAQSLLVLLPARLTRWKGHRETVAAIAEAAGRLRSRQRIDLQVVFAGDRGRRADFPVELERDIERRGVGTMVKTVGHCADMPAAYALADMVLCPSTEPEAFGRVAVEAAAMERCAIGSDHGGQRETIVDGETGFLVAPGDVAGLTDAIVQVAEMGPAGRRRMGEAARRRVAARYSMDAMCGATLAAYRRVLDQKTSWVSGTGMGVDVRT